MITSERMGRMYIDHVTGSALRRKPRSQTGLTLTIAIIVAALGLLAVGSFV